VKDHCWPLPGSHTTQYSLAALTALLPRCVKWLLSRTVVSWSSGSKKSLIEPDHP